MRHAKLQREREWLCAFHALPEPLPIIPGTHLGVLCHRSAPTRFEYYIAESICNHLNVVAVPGESEERFRNLDETIQGGRDGVVANIRDWQEKQEYMRKQKQAQLADDWEQQVFAPIQRAVKEHVDAKVRLL